MRESKKILVIRLSSLGDILLTYPLLSLLKKNFPDSEINFIVKEIFLDAIRFNSFVDQAIGYSVENYREIKSYIKKNNFDVVIDLQNNFRSRQLYNLRQKIRIFRFKKPTIKKFFLVKFKLNFLKNNPSIALQYIGSVFPDYNSSHLDLYFNVPDEIEKAKLKKIPEELLSKKIIGICPGSKHYTKRYPVDSFKKLIQKFIDRNYNVAIFGGKQDYEICKELETNSSVKNFQNDDDLLETAVIMKLCSAVITNDSGLMHLASMLQIPTVAIFGSTVAEFGFFPIYYKSIIVENKNLDCRPCSHIGRSECPRKHFKCMLEINPDLVFQKTIELITNKN